MTDFFYWVGDVVSLTVLLGYFIAGLPVLATMLTVIWTGIRIYQEPTVQRWLGKDKDGSIS